MVHPVGLAVLVLFGIFLITVKRDKIAFPFVFMSVFIPSSQSIVVAGFDLYFLRIIVIFAWLRVFLRNEHRSLKINKLDILVILWSISSVVAYTVQQQSTSALINRLGYMVDTTGMYFSFRFLIRDYDDVEVFFKAFAIAGFPVLFFFLLEKFTRFNVFSVLGGVPSVTAIREGKLRVQGAFAHPILAGCYWGALLPYYFSDLYINRRKIFVNGMISIVFVILILLTSSSTPVLGAAVGVSHILLFRYRSKYKYIPALMILVYFLLDSVMDRPVWHLLARIDIAGGSTGWHRFHLIDQAIRNFTQWALVGVRSIGSWNVWGNDITNQYILEAVRGGIFTLFLYFAIIWIGLKYGVSLTIKVVDKDLVNRAYVLWALCGMLLVHAVNFIGVSYFGQIIMLQYLILAMISSLWNYEEM